MYDLVGASGIFIFISTGEAILSKIRMALRYLHLVAQRLLLYKSRPASRLLVDSLSPLDVLFSDQIIRAESIP